MVSLISLWGHTNFNHDSVQVHGWANRSTQNESRIVSCGASVFFFAWHMLADSRTNIWQTDDAGRSLMLAVSAVTGGWWTSSHPHTHLPLPIDIFSDKFPLNQLPLNTIFHFSSNHVITTMTFFMKKKHLSAWIKEISTTSINLYIICLISIGACAMGCASQGLSHNLSASKRFLVIWCELRV